MVLQVQLYSNIATAAARIVMVVANVRIVVEMV
jgi:hypothetical protein